MAVIGSILEDIAGSQFEFGDIGDMEKVDKE